RWNQPLHPEREAPLRSNPHAVRPTLGDRTTNGHAEPPAPAPVEPAARTDLRSTVAAEPTPIQHAEHAPVPATVEVPEPTRIEIPPAADDRVTVSKRAVAVGIVLALGLPLS